MVSTICDVDDVNAQQLIMRFYCAMLGYEGTNGDAVQVISSTSFDTIEALQAAMTLQMHYSPGNLDNPAAWAGYVATGLPVDQHGPKTSST